MLNIQIESFKIQLPVKKEYEQHILRLNKQLQQDVKAMLDHVPNSSHMHITDVLLILLLSYAQMLEESDKKLDMYKKQTINDQHISQKEQNQKNKNIDITTIQGYIDHLMAVIQNES